jgi:hypothetical protein
VLGRVVMAVTAELIASVRLRVKTAHSRTCCAGVLSCHMYFIPARVLDAAPGDAWAGTACAPRSKVAAVMATAAARMGRVEVSIGTRFVEDPGRGTLAA